MKKLIFLFIAISVLCFGMMGGCASDNADNSITEKIETTDTTLSETEAPVVEYDHPVNEEDARVTLLNKIPLDADTVKLVKAEYQSYGDRYAFHYEGVDSTSYGGVQVVINVQIVYSPVDGVYEYDHCVRGVKKLVNYGDVLGRWVDDSGDYRLNITDISDREVFFDYEFNGVSGSGSSIYTCNVDSRVGGGTYGPFGLKLSMISDIEDMRVYFYAESCVPPDVAWYLDDGIRLVRDAEK